MRLQVLDPHASFSCRGCTNCCTQPYAVIIEQEKARALQEHDFSAYPQLAGKTLFTESKDAPDGFHVLAKQEGSTRCLFLADDGLCIIHKELGAEAKPHPCLRFPYHVSTSYTEDRISLDFGCPTVQADEGASLASQQADVTAVCKVSPASVFPDAQVDLTAATQLSHEEYEALLDRLESLFSAPGEQSVWMRFAEALSLLESVEREKRDGDIDLADVLSSGGFAPDALTLPETTPYAEPGAAPSLVRMLFAATLLRDVLPPDVTLNMSLWRRVLMLPKLMPLVKLTGRYQSKLLGRIVDIDAVLAHPLRCGLQPSSSFLLQRYFRTRIWQRFLVGTRLSVTAGIHQHILDLGAILFLARAMAAHDGSDRLTEAHLSAALSHVELNIANQPRLFGQKALGWFTGQMDDIELARGSLRLMALNADAGDAATRTVERRTASGLS